MKQIKLEKRAVKFLERLSLTERERLLKAIHTYPYKDVKKLKGSPFYRMRVGNYRVIYDDEGNVVSIIDIGNRGDIYKRY